MPGRGRKKKNRLGEGVTQLVVRTPASGRGHPKMTGKERREQRRAARQEETAGRMATDDPTVQYHAACDAIARSYAADGLRNVTVTHVDSIEDAVKLIAAQTKGVTFPEQPVSDVRTIDPRLDGAGGGVAAGDAEPEPEPEGDGGVATGSNLTPMATAKVKEHMQCLVETPATTLTVGEATAAFQSPFSRFLEGARDAAEGRWRLTPSTFGRDQDQEFLERLPYRSIQGGDILIEECIVMETGPLSFDHIVPSHEIFPSLFEAPQVAGAPRKDLVPVTRATVGRYPALSGTSKIDGTVYDADEYMRSMMFRIMAESITGLRACQRVSAWGMEMQLVHAGGPKFGGVDVLLGVTDCAVHSVAMYLTGGADNLLDAEVIKREKSHLRAAAMRWWSQMFEYLASLIVPPSMVAGYGIYTYFSPRANSVANAQVLPDSARAVMSNIIMSPQVRDDVEATLIKTLLASSDACVSVAGKDPLRTLWLLNYGRSYVEAFNEYDGLKGRQDKDSFRYRSPNDARYSRKAERLQYSRYHAIARKSVFEDLAMIGEPAQGPRYTMEQIWMVFTEEVFLVIKAYTMAHTVTDSWAQAKDLVDQIRTVFETVRGQAGSEAKLAAGALKMTGVSNAIAAERLPPSGFDRIATVPCLQHAARLASARLARGVSAIFEDANFQKYVKPLA